MQSLMCHFIPMLGKSPAKLNMTIAVYWDVKHQTNKQIYRYPWASTLRSGVIEGKPTLQGNYGLNMNDEWLHVRNCGVNSTNVTEGSRKDRIYEEFRIYSTFSTFILIL